MSAENVERLAQLCQIPQERVSSVLRFQLALCLLDLALYGESHSWIGKITRKDGTITVEVHPKIARLSNGEITAEDLLQELDDFL
jgi:hypothetical protein